MSSTEFLTLIYRILPSTFLFELALAGLAWRWQIARRKTREAKRNEREE